jgi:hypothetical protein
MNLLTSYTPGRKRLMIFAPAINPHSFLFFFEKGNNGYSYSLRDYSVLHRVTERYAREFGCSADEIRRKATTIFDAPFLDTHSLSEWHAYTNALNESQGVRPADSATLVPSAPAVQESKPGGRPTEFPMLYSDTLAAMPKSAKVGDLRRMLESPRSEDWLTWNLLNLLLACRPATWWEHLVTCARKANPDVAVSIGPELPQFGFWRLQPSPKMYEQASRERMRVSADPLMVARSKDPKPVEGNSEIDVVIESKSFLVYIEAKLEADISMRTTYDPRRNQIVRNIDCVLEAATARTPQFWMFVRDVGSGRAYVELIRQYRDRPEILFHELPHRDPAVLRELARSLVLLTWRDISAGICEPAPGDSELMLSVKRELKRRIQ